MENKKRKAPVIAAVVILIILILVGIALFIIWSMALNTDNNDKFDSSPSTEIFEPMIKSIVLGSEQEVTQDSINGIIAYLIKNQSENAEQNSLEADFKITDIAVYLHENESSELYVKFDYNGTSLILSAKADIELVTDNKTVVLTLSDTKLGALPIPTEWVLDKMKESDALSAVSDSVKIEDRKIIAPASYTLDIANFELSLDLTELTPKDGYALLATTSAMDQIKGFLEDFLFSRSN